MKILMQSRKTLFTVPGGDTMQVMKTAEALRKLGCVVDVSTDLEPEVGGYDVVHLFNLARPQEAYLQAKNARAQGKRVVLSTIYVDFSEYDRIGRTGLSGALSRIAGPEATAYLKVLARAAVNGEINKGTLHILLNGFTRLQNRILETMDVLLPNSESELRRVRRDFPCSDKAASVVVPNGIDRELFGISANVTPRAARFRDCVLCVARVEGLKNQLNLVRAMKNLPWPLVLIGKPAPNHADYFDRINKEAGPNVHFLGQVDHQDLPSYYRAARVHALPSWMETTGLSSLEAAGSGCNIVVTPKGDTRDYFGDRAFYCAPESVDSIRAAVVRAYEAPVDPGLRNHVLYNFTWDKAAEMTLKGYELALSDRSRSR